MLWDKVLLENLSVAQQAKKFPFPYKSKCHYRACKTQQLVTVLSHMNQIHINQPYYSDTK
jgi:hypothetical protein